MPVGEIAYIRMTGPIKPEGRCGASAQAQPQAPGPSPGPGYYDSLWVEGCSQDTGHLRLETEDGSTVFARTTVTVRGAPDGVTNLSAEGRIGGRIYVDWTAPSNNGGAALTGYHVQRKLSSDSSWPGGSDVVTPGSNTDHEIQNLIGGRYYDVQVQACNAASLTCSGVCFRLAICSPSFGPVSNIYPGPGFGGQVTPTELTRTFENKSVYDF